MKKIITKKSSMGFSLVEMVLVLGLLGMFIVLVGDFQAKVFYFNRVFQGGIYSQTDASNIVKSIGAEMRSMSQSSRGAYPIEQAGTSTLSFFNDLDDDGIKEEIHYYLTGTTFKKGVIKPTGSPLNYDSASEVVTNVITNVRNGTSTPIFTYYNTSYDGTTATSSLSLPIDVIAIRLIKINIILDADPSQPLVPLYVTTQVSLRNLKDNI